MFDFLLSRRRATLRGLLAVVLGLLAIVWPGLTIGALVVVVGIWAIIGGIAEIAAASSGADRGGWLVVGGIASILAGIVLLAWPEIGAVTLALVLGSYLLVYGISLLVAAATTPSGETVGGLPT